MIPKGFHYSISMLHQEPFFLQIVLLYSFLLSFFLWSAPGNLRDVQCMNAELGYFEKTDIKLVVSNG